MGDDKKNKPDGRFKGNRGNRGRQKKVPGLHNILDSVGEVTNLYAYAGNNSINYIDPDGLQWIPAVREILREFREFREFRNSGDTILNSLWITA